MDDAIVDALSASGITHAFDIQEMVLPVALSGRDVVGQAKTGTGKTLGFGIPLLMRVRSRESGAPLALVVVPTRELCLQVATDLQNATTDSTRIVALFGGRAIEPQIKDLKAGCDIVVGTPGRLLDLYGQRYLDLSAIEALVLDEADEMLDMGFLPDVERIISYLPATRQTMLFSATMPGQIMSLARRYQTNPLHVRAHSADDTTTVDAIEQHVWRVHAMDKVEIVARILQAQDRGRTIIFTNTKRAAHNLSSDLDKRGFTTVSVHGDLAQHQRERSLRAFRSDKADILVATDVAARGIDVDGVTHVINYSCPDDEKTYLHRIGRTGRAGASGVAVTFVDWEDTTRWLGINQALGLAFNQPVETYSTSEHVYRGLNIPESAGSALPGSERVREKFDKVPAKSTSTRTRTRRGKSAPARKKNNASAHASSASRRRRRRTRGGRDIAAEKNAD